jgi:cardiolipin synthase A/B
MTRKRAATIAVTFAVTLLAVLLFLNFSAGEKQITQRIEHSYAVSDPQFARAMGVLLGPPLAAGNRGETLINGDQIFPSMLGAIRGAKRSITFETYIYWSGGIGREFADALSQRARGGVRVHVLLDWVGSQKMEDAYIDEMRSAGVEIEKYHKPKWYTLGKLNNRTHRKLLVVDGEIGFTGGVGIADEWSGHAQDRDHWRDTHFRIEGPAVAQMQAAFADNWTKVTGSVLDGPDYFPELKPAGSQIAQVFKSSRDGGAESMHLMYLLAIAAATRSIQLSMSYFVPDAVSEQALLAALERGVRIQIIVPGEQSDAEAVRHASRARWGALLRAGAEIHEYQPTMYHCKVFVVDGLWVSVGSTNFDTRSFQLNDEANLNVYDRAFAQRQIAVFGDDLARSRRITYEEWAQRPWTEKLGERLLSLIGAQL